MTALTFNLFNKTGVSNRDSYKKKKVKKITLLLMSKEQLKKKLLRYIPKENLRKVKKK